MSKLQINRVVGKKSANAYKRQNKVSQITITCLLQLEVLVDVVNCQTLVVVSGARGPVIGGHCVAVNIVDVKLVDQNLLNSRFDLVKEQRAQILPKDG